MKRKALVKIHLIAAIVAVITIISFFSSTVIVELTGNHEKVIRLKSVIFYSLPLLIVAMPTIAITGARLASNSQHPDITSKRRRMKWITTNGISLVAIACFLFYYSANNQIDRTFFVFQAAELVLGLSNIVLLGLNFRAGLRLSGRLSRAVHS
jgi:hypothetical protein